MRATEFLTEWRNDYLYHATSVPRAIDIWHEDNLGKGASVSTTRSYNYALGYLKNIASGNYGGVIFWIDQNLLRQDIGRRRLKGTDWFVANEPTAVSNDFQRRSDMDDTDRFETLIKQGLSPFRKYVAKIEVWLPKSREYDPNAPGYTRMGDHPDKNYINVRVNQELMNNNWFHNPINRKTWEALKQDPRTEIKGELGSPWKYQGKGIQIHQQFNQNHSMYDPYNDEHR